MNAEMLPSLQPYKCRNFNLTRRRKYVL